MSSTGAFHSLPHASPSNSVVRCSTSRCAASALAASSCGLLDAGYGVADPMPDPPNCDGLAASISAKAEFTDEETLRVTLGAPKMPGSHYDVSADATLNANITLDPETTLLEQVITATLVASRSTSLSSPTRAGCKSLFRRNVRAAIRAFDSISPPRTHARSPMRPRCRSSSSMTTVGNVDRTPAASRSAPAPPESNWR